MTAECVCGEMFTDPDEFISHLMAGHSPLPDRVALAREHKGRFVWRNPAESVWECADDCPHPSHEEALGG